MKGRVAELGCGHAAHTAAHRAAEHAETGRHAHAAPHLPNPEADLPGSADPGARPTDPDAAGQFGRGYVTRRAVRRAVHVTRLSPGGRSGKNRSRGIVAIPRLSGRAGGI